MNREEDGDVERPSSFADAHRSKFKIRDFEKAVRDSGFGLRSICRAIWLRAVGRSSAENSVA